MHQHLEVRIGACPDYVWAVLTDVARWPEWSSSLRAVEVFDGGPLVVGGGMRVRQRGLPDRTWRVTELRPHRGFTWEGGGLGSASRLRVRMGRSVEGRGTDVTVDLDRSGWVGGAVGAMTAATSSAHLEELFDGLRRRCEAGQCAPAAPAASAPGARHGS
ncbi:SRPBCC family protein [Actinomycetospora termitidis]|uniref:SRPBCC family protein n=1 Tax=Actinomycetospora termitidis TaxID=3053470 RepID=A0ABT7M4V1_9PSEU|nr:SRPBCC family protein [Actinomycetospora sp. Odt1-22]MDL5155707.1 SRPBCC family protein [Actinomycetospora sp. Odt1-22]